MHEVKLSIPFLLIPALTLADHGSINLGTGSASPIATETAITLPTGNWSASLRTEYIRNDGISDAKLQTLRAEDAEADLHTSKALWTYSAGIAYGVTDNFSIGIKLPFIYRNDIKEPEHGHEDEVEVAQGHEDEDDDHGHEDENEGDEHGHEDNLNHAEDMAEILNLGDVDGIGDASFYGQYRFLKRQDTHASVILGLKAPTGITNRKSSGEKLDAEFQPGSGSWDGIFGLAFTQQMDAFSFDSSLIYSLSTEGTQDTDLGDVFSYNFAASYNILGQNNMSLASSPIGVDLIMEINGEWRDKEETNGVKDPNSGGNLLFLSPGLRVRATNFVNFAVSVGLPVVKDTNGDQDEPDYRIIGNVNFRF